MQGDASSNEDSLSMPADAKTPPETHDDDVFAAELQDLEQRLVTEFRQPLQVQSHLEMPRILVQLGHTQHT